MYNYRIIELSQERALNYFIVRECEFLVIVIKLENQMS